MKRREHKKKTTKTQRDKDKEISKKQGSVPVPLNQNKIKIISVAPLRIELRSKVQETFVLSIELRSYYRFRISKVS